MSDGKREIIARLIEEYDIRSAEDIQNALRDLLGRTIQGMMEGEMETQKKEKQEEDPAYTDSRNGYKTKTLRSNYGPVEVNVPLKIARAITIQRSCRSTVGTSPKLTRRSSGCTLAE